MKNQEQDLSLATTQKMDVAQPEHRQMPTSIELLQTALQGDITPEKVGVAKDLMAMMREEKARQDKQSFNKAFFELRREIQTLQLSADKQAKDQGGNVMYIFCSETELSEKLEPVLLKHGFSMLFSQKQEGDLIYAIITLIHESGHEHVASYAVRAGATNRVKDATAADSGATTTAWRHLCIKLFGLKSRIRETNDPRNVGSAITREQADGLQSRFKMVFANNHTRERSFLKWAGVADCAENPTLEDYQKIPTSRFEKCSAWLSAQEKGGK